MMRKSWCLGIALLAAIAVSASVNAQEVPKNNSDTSGTTINDSSGAGDNPSPGVDLGSSSGYGPTAIVPISSPQLDNLLAAEGLDADLLSQIAKEGGLTPETIQKASQDLSQKIEQQRQECNSSQLSPVSNESSLPATPGTVRRFALGPAPTNATCMSPACQQLVKLTDMAKDLLALSDSFEKTQQQSQADLSQRVW